MKYEIMQCFKKNVQIQFLAKFIKFRNTLQSFTFLPIMLSTLVSPNLIENNKFLNYIQSHFWQLFNREKK